MDLLLEPSAPTEVEALTEALSQSYEEAALLHRVSERMQVAQRPESFFADVCRDLGDILDVELMLVLQPEAVGSVGPVRILSHAGDLRGLEKQSDLLWFRACRQARADRGILVDDGREGPLHLTWPQPIRDIVAIPVQRDQTVLAVVVAINKRSRSGFNSTDIKLLQAVAGDIAVYLDNSRLYQDLQELLMGSLCALTRSIDAKDPYTCGHSERVAHIGRYLAERMTLPAAQINTIYLTGLLHDIGKIGVQEAVLCKPGRLLPGEFEQIRRHPQIGANILGGIKQMAEVTPGVLSHHERYDGAGYPKGLVGRQIPLAGRIIQLADSFDAMITDRTYHQALPIAAALAEIRRFSGTQFDPELADVLLALDTRRLVDDLHHIASHPNPLLDMPCPV